ncbi:MAG: Stk1 family PASTA domain-containing Ser/Thr kinase [Acetatifactor sp.]
MIKIGMMIGNRYEILEKIGTGGMSDVYKAKCHKLNRFVAVKVLKQEFSENANFVSKFQIEAQAAAGLMHPNIVNVYDVGEENGIYYIVMELVEGITLKKYIEKKSHLSYKEAVSVAIQVSMGIEVAHNNHIIHRDIKPQNIIISRDGKAKVTDFGIAKAATSNTITSNVMGSVHYTSPEQARGGYSDEKSDIYSLGITMYEMLTGRVPFNGETTVAIAIKHIQEEMPSPRTIVPEIPESVEQIVMKCCQKSPERRYQRMHELIADLKQSLIHPNENFVVDNEPDIDGDTRMITESEVAQIKQRTAYREDASNEGVRLRTDVEAMYEEEETPEYDEEYGYNPRMEKVTTILTVIFGVIILIIVVILAAKVFGSTDRNRNPGSSSGIVQIEESSGNAEADQKNYVTMPGVTGKLVEEARNLLFRNDINAEVRYVESDEVAAGIVISVDVLEGESILRGSTVNLVASAGPTGIEVPSVQGNTYTFEDASSILTAKGFMVSRASAYSETVSEGRIIAQSPVAGSMAPKNSTVVLTVSLGKEPTKVSVPKLLGLTEDEGTAVANEHGLSIGQVTHVYSSYESGLICYQSYSPEVNVEPGTSIDIHVSQGPKPAAGTYKFSGSIGAPTVEEAPDYRPGSVVELKLVTDDGMVLLEKSVTEFPYDAVYTGLASSGGTLTMTYIVTTESTTTTDENGNTVTIPGSTQEKSFTRRIEFTAE